MAETTAREVANYLLYFSAEHGDPITNLKLQKLLYYSQAWYLALYDAALFNEQIEAWIHGPAIPPVYVAYKQLGWQPLPPPDSRPEVMAKVDAHLKEVIEAYGEFSAYQLEQMTHQEDPWRIARNGLPPDEPSHNVILHEHMSVFYKKRLAEHDNQSG